MNLRGVLSVILLALLGAPLWAQQMSAGSPDMAKKNLIDIGGGRRMNIVCIGEGSPAVVFDYGLSGHILKWQKVQAAVSATTRACFYDRAGYGYSDPSPRPRTAASIVDDLHRLLAKARVAHPLVLVGSSIGGLYVTLYADRYPSEVAGLVLVDPSFAGQEVYPASPQLKRDQEELAGEERDAKRCAALARSGKLSEAEPHDCFGFSSGRTRYEIDYLLDQFCKPFRYESRISEALAFREGVDYSEDSLEERRAARPFGSMPVIVLTRDASADAAGANDEEAKREEARWLDGHNRLAARSSRGESIIVAGAGHEIELDKPEAVDAAILKVIAEARSGHTAVNRDRPLSGKP